MSDKRIGSRFGGPVREWVPAPIESAAKQYVLMALAAARPQDLDVARDFATYCEQHPHNGYDPEQGYLLALEVLGHVRTLVIPTDELDDIPERWRSS
jgi:hypothetical protein